VTNTAAGAFQRDQFLIGFKLPREDFVYRANIDHYLGLLNDPDLASETRATVVKLLVHEEDKLAYYEGQLTFVESLLADNRDLLNRLENSRDGFADGSKDRERADRSLENVKALHQLLDQFRHRVRARINLRGI
jgi:hypothetical protein